MPDFTAVRTWNAGHTKATVTVTKPNGKTVELGGNRAIRAAAVLVAKWADEDFTRVLGLRADINVARSEAERTVRGTKRITNPAEWADAVPIEEVTV